MQRTNFRLLWVVLLLGTLTLPSQSNLMAAPTKQVNVRYFQETGKTLSGRFLDYWNKNGGLVQQGYPISDLMSERSDTDGKIYTVQYFERAVFEAHPENAAPNDVLLSLLGRFVYDQRYPRGATGQVPSASVSSRLFTQTGKRLGGIFLSYWDANGGLPQQGYPISEEFTETSDLNGKLYKVQYFERAVFEYHPENGGTKYEVLLSQLGRTRYDARYGHTAAPTSVTLPTTNTPTKVVATPTLSPNPAPSIDCSGIPQDQGLSVTPRCGYLGMTIRVSASGFLPSENIQWFATRPDGTRGSSPTLQADANGNFTDENVIVSRVGIWAVTATGLQSGRRVVGYFKIAGSDLTACRDGLPPLGDSASVSPSCGNLSTQFNFAGWGFQPGERVGYYWTYPDQSVEGLTNETVIADQNGYVTGPTFQAGYNGLVGIYGLTLEGVQSHHKGVGYIKISP